MSSSAALSGAALRMLRTAAGRRALQVALLVGGVLFIGLLCGERAYAADGVRASADSTAGRSVSGQRLLVRPDAPASADRAVRLADDTGEAVGRELAKAQAKLPAPPKAPSLPDVPAVPVPPKAPTLPIPPKAPSVPVPSGLPDLPTLPDLSTLPDAPAMPDLPGLPGPTAPPDGDVAAPGAPALPGLPGYPAFPGHPLPAAPVTVDPQPGGMAAPSSDTLASPGRTGEADPVAHGPHGAQYRAPHADRAARGHADHDRAHHVRRAAHPGPSASVGGAIPVGHVPGGRPDGTLCNRSMADSGTPRHGDTHAVTLSRRAPLSLVRGVAARSRVAGTRDSHRDIPVFPG
ncbi:hypothetical protein [Streptomyces sp. NPDC056948]|uniref:hypothetical protein n=1 Tax=Streptomyces sp. NPDC056948 TaxID=3345975 RepID=UPI003627D106